MKTSVYYQKLKQFRDCFCEVTNTFLKFNEFFNLVQLYSNRNKPDLYKIDWNKFHNYIVKNGYC